MPDLVTAFMTPPANPLMRTSYEAAATSICDRASSETGLAFDNPPLVPDEESPYMSLLAMPLIMKAL